jgi:hypothetical protein
MAKIVLDRINGSSSHYSLTCWWFGCAAILHHYECIAFYNCDVANELGLLKALKIDVTKMNAIQEARITPRAINNPRSWQQRLGLIMHYPHTETEVQHYIDTQFVRLLKVFSVNSNAVTWKWRFVK